MMLPIAYDTVLVLTCVYLWRSGGRTGRWGVVLYLFITAITIAGTILGERFQKLAPIILTADLILLFGLLALAFSSSRRWPIWASAMQINCVSAHIVVMLAPVVVARVYYAMETMWGLPMLLVMAGGTALDQRSSRRQAAKQSEMA